MASAIEQRSKLTLSRNQADFVKIGKKWLKYCIHEPGKFSNKRNIIKYTLYSRKRLPQNGNQTLLLHDEANV